jgi:hypothetical protein
MSRTVALVFRVRNDKPPDTIRRHQYGPNAAEYLELIPAAPKSLPKTAIVYFHGGGWISGSSDISPIAYSILPRQDIQFSTSNIRWLQSIRIHRFCTRPLPRWSGYVVTILSMSRFISWVTRPAPTWQ